MNHNAKIKTFEKNRLDKQNQGASVERFYEYFVPKGLWCVPQWYASVPRGAKDRKRSDPSGDLSRTPKVVRNREVPLPISPAARVAREGIVLSRGYSAKSYRFPRKAIKRNALRTKFRKIRCSSLTKITLILNHVQANRASHLPLPKPGALCAQSWLCIKRQ